jgi:hypothetical protein
MPDEKFVPFWDDPEEKKRVKAMQEFKDRSFKCESHLENYFARKVKEAGGMAIKFNPTTNAGLPDRIVFYKGRTWLVELKMPKGRVSPVQQVMHNRFKLHGFPVTIVRTKEDVAKFINTMTQRIIEGL